MRALVHVLNLQLRKRKPQRKHIDPTFVRTKHDLGHTSAYGLELYVVGNLSTVYTVLYRNEADLTYDEVVRKLRTFGPLVGAML